MIHRALMETRDKQILPYEMAMYRAARDIQDDIVRHFQRQILTTTKQDAGDLDLDDDEDGIAYIADQYSRFIPSIERTFRAGGRIGLTKARSGLSFNVRNPAAERFLRNRSQRFVEQVSETAWSEMKAKLAEGLEEGASIDELAEIVASTPAFSAARAEMIARTEAIGAYNGGLEEGFRQSGNVSQKVWLAAIDDRTRDTHIALHEQMVPVSGDFVSTSGASGPAPGQLGTAEEDINCRCTIEAIIGVPGEEIEEVPYGVNSTETIN